MPPEALTPPPPDAAGQADRDRPDLSVVIPAYNEAARLGPTLERIGDYLAARGRSAEIIVVDDGSSDGTGELARAFRPAGPVAVRVLANPANRGKGYSVGRGVLAAAGRTILVTDADLSAPIEQFDRLADWLTRGWHAAIGSRDMPDSQLRPPQPMRRRLLARAFGAVRRLFLVGDLRDTQCGFKAFEAEAARRIFTLQQTAGFAYDFEVLAIARRLGYRVKEVGIVWGNDRDSRVRPLRDGLRMLAALPAIRWRVRKVSREVRHE